MSNTALYHKSLSLTEALMNYRHQPIYRRLRRLGKRESMLHPDVRQRRGVGKSLLQEAIAHGPQLGIHSLVGLIFGHNQPSIALFRAAGCERWGLLPGVARVDETAQRPNDLWTPYLMEGRALSGPNLSWDDTAVVPPVSPSRLLVTDDEMDNAIWRGDEEAIEILA
jgi:hypothetical protein